MHKYIQLQLYKYRQIDSGHIVLVAAQCSKFTSNITMPNYIGNTQVPLSLRLVNHQNPSGCPLQEVSDSIHIIIIEKSPPNTTASHYAYATLCNKMFGLALVLYYVITHTHTHNLSLSFCGSIVYIYINIYLFIYLSACLILVPANRSIFVYLFI